MSPTRRRRSEPPTEDELVDVVLTTSRVLVAIAARSLAAVHDDITLVQYRALVVLAYRGAQRVADLAAELGVNSSTATRLCDRLDRKGLVHRTTDPGDRRATCIEVTADGRGVVTSVMAHRRREISRLLRDVPSAERRAVVTALSALNDAAGETPEQSWSLGWTG
jgi:DNA-binding MarR family transcriptional regulator